MRCPRCGGKGQAVATIGQFRRWQCETPECRNMYLERIADDPPHEQVHPDQLPERRSR